MRYLLLSSLLFLCACTSVYKQLQQSPGDPACITKFQPDFTSALYTTHVNVVGNHLSGLVLFKTMPDSSKRVVFSSEMGLTFFDFEFMKDGGFKVHYIIKKMDKKAVIRTLRSDFELVLMNRLQYQDVNVKRSGDELYHTFPQKKGSNYYITDLNCSGLKRIEKSSRRKPLVTVLMQNYIDGIPDTIGISHTNFAFTIGLKRLIR